MNKRRMGKIIIEPGEEELIVELEAIRDELLRNRSVVTEDEVRALYELREKIRIHRALEILLLSGSATVRYPRQAAPLVEAIWTATASDENDAAEAN